jgi:hypothetical protein
MKKFCPVLMGLLLYLGPSVPSAWAESFRIQDGTLGGGGLFWNSGIPADAFGGFGLSSGEFTLGGVTFNPEIVQPGQQFTLTEILGGKGNMAGEVGVPSAGGHDVDVRGTSDLRVTFGRLLAPAPFPADFGFIELTTAFSISGVLNGILLEQLEDSTLRPLGSFRTEVFGHGSGTVILQPLFETSNYQVVEFDGTFEPTPEPGTIVLLGLGAVTLATRVARRHKATGRLASQSLHSLTRAARAALGTS